ncbi:retinol dehydrogenase 14 [Byssothecium circinans]|uniref:Retinol dehydrogenase 14 n=1 Tax=Byssothecium circinans TaxID=147558 RepID=A0A6A5TUR1_9PLEO|nr:retinol dehydrogenase 14 [Byssothecium circinans]
MPLCTHSIPFNPTTSIPSLTGKTILITGANIGLGKQCVLKYALHNPSKIYPCTRNLQKARLALDDIKSQLPPTNTTTIEILQLDLASLDSVTKAAAIVRQASERLDILMLNAGIMAAPPDQTVDGYELQFGTSFLGHALLTKLLLPLLQTTAALPDSDVCVIALTSYGHSLTPKPSSILFDKLKTSCGDLGAYERYGMSKLALILWARRMANVYPGFTTVSIHPGVVRTNLSAGATDSHWAVKMLLRVAEQLPLVASPEQGARNQLWASVAKDVVSGEYYEPVGVMGKGSELTKDDGLMEKLWEWTAKELEGYTV